MFVISAQFVILFSCEVPINELPIVTCTEVDEGGDHRDHLHVMGHIGGVVDLAVVRGEAAVDVVNSEVTVLERLTASIQAKIVSEVLWIGIPQETMAGQAIIGVSWTIC